MGDLVILVVIIVPSFIILLIGIKSKNLAPKITILVIAVLLICVAGYFGVLIYNISAARVDAKVISVEKIDEDYYKLEYEYTYKKKIYRTYFEAEFREEPEIGSKMGVIVDTDNPTVINIYGGDGGLSSAFLGLGLLIFGGNGIIIFIPITINIIIYKIKARNIRTKQALDLL